MPLRFVLALMISTFAIACDSEDPPTGPTGTPTTLSNLSYSPT